MVLCEYTRTRTNIKANSPLGWTVEWKFTPQRDFYLILARVAIKLVIQLPVLSF